MIDKKQKQPILNRYESF